MQGCLVVSTRKNEYLFSRFAWSRFFPTAFHGATELSRPVGWVSTDPLGFPLKPKFSPLVGVDSQEFIISILIENRSQLGR